jgi:hypothetical protein
LLTLCTQCEAIRKGNFYCLQAANEHAKGYDSQQMYTYLRHTPSQKLLIIVNFDRVKEQKAHVKIPAAAWKAMGLEGAYQFTDLLELHSDVVLNHASSQKGHEIEVELPHWGAAILEIKSRPALG